MSYRIIGRSRMIKKPGSQPEIRKDPLNSRWVIISKERAKRPNAWIRMESKTLDHVCPFCPGNEIETPPEVFSIRKSGTNANEPGWSIRVISNKYPALRIEVEASLITNQMYQKIGGVGAHEVLIETPNHDMDITNMSLEHIANIFWVLRERYEDLKKDHRFKYIMIFKNHGRLAGSSVDHPHIQIIAIPLIPKSVAEELEGARLHYREHKRCIFCDMIDNELNISSRLVMETEHFVTIEPFAARTPYETWILPKIHQSRFEEIRPFERIDLAKILKNTLYAINESLGKPAFNLILHTSPQTDSDFPEYHWHLEIIPKLMNFAGFEMGTGFYINPVPPEEAADVLRDASFK